tara:strand:+ start:496 stop:615 length:120 start_codon:yes stop_codon:yes gene_type:complete
VKIYILLGQKNELVWCVLDIEERTRRWANETGLKEGKEE